MKGSARNDTFSIEYVSKSCQQMSIWSIRSRVIIVIIGSPFSLWVAALLYLVVNLKYSSVFITLQCLLQYQKSNNQST